MSRDLMRPSPRRCLALAALLSSGACMPVAILQADREALLKELDIARARVHCDPVALALAEANLTFADVELDEGDARRALEHITEGRSHAEIASA